MLAEINGTQYRVEFNYRRPDPKLRVPRPRFHGSAACVIVCEHPPRKFMAIGHSVCSSTERFSRREGRKRAFADAVVRCGLLDHNDALRFFVWFAQRFPDAPPPRRITTRLTDVEIAWRKEQGRMRKAAKQ